MPTLAEMYDAAQEPYPQSLMQRFDNALNQWKRDPRGAAMSHAKGAALSMADLADLISAAVTPAAPLNAHRTLAGLLGATGDPAEGAGGLLGMPTGTGAKLATMAAGKIGPEVLGLLGAIKAYHGSPHTFDKFDMSKIGTGEGAQAYGHGLYFAENPATAANYYRQLGGDYQPIVSLKMGTKRVGPFNGFDYSPRGNSTLENIHSSLIEDVLIDELGLRGAAANGNVGVRDFVLNRLDNNIKNYRNEWPEAVQPAMDLRRMLEKQGAIDLKLGPSSGGIYETSLRWPDPAREAADPLGPQHFLQWDKPLSEQPKNVQSFIQQSYPQQYQNMLAASQLETEIKSLANKYGKPGDSYKDAISRAPDNVQQAWRGLISQHASLSTESPGSYLPTSGESIYRSLGNDQTASTGLQQQGIPGIRYLDAGSRGAGAGTANYVLFDDALAEILKRNGVALGAIP